MFSSISAAVCSSTCCSFCSCLHYQRSLCKARLPSHSLHIRTMPSISYYEQRVPQYFASDTTMVFLNGTHYLETLQPLVIKDIEIFIMIGSSGFTIGLEGLLEAKSKIECVVSGFNFINMSGIQHYKPYIHLLWSRSGFYT